MRVLDRGAVTAVAADDECLGPDTEVRVGRVIAEHGLGWPSDAEPCVLAARAAAADAHRVARLAAIRPPLTFGGGLSTVLWNGAGVEPATDDLSGRCSTRLSYPVVAIRESNPAPRGAIH